MLGDLRALLVQLAVGLLESLLLLRHGNEFLRIDKAGLEEELPQGVHVDGGADIHLIVRRTVEDAREHCLVFAVHADKGRSTVRDILAPIVDLAPAVYNLDLASYRKAAGKVKCYLGQQK